MPLSSEAVKKPNQLKSLHNLQTSRPYIESTDRLTKSGKQVSARLGNVLRGFSSGLPNQVGGILSPPTANESIGSADGSMGRIPIDGTVDKASEEALMMMLNQRPSSKMMSDGLGPLNPSTSQKAPTIKQPAQSVVVSPTLSKAGRIFQGKPTNSTKALKVKTATSIELKGSNSLVTSSVQDVKNEMRDNAEAAFLAVSEEAPSNNQDELDDLQNVVGTLGASFNKVGTDQFDKDYQILLKQGDQQVKNKYPVRQRIIRRVTMQPSPQRQHETPSSLESKMHPLNFDDPWGEPRLNQEYASSKLGSPENLSGIYVRNGKPKRVDKRFSEIPSKYMLAKQQNQIDDIPLESKNSERKSISPTKKSAIGRPYITKPKMMF